MKTARVVLVGLGPLGVNMARRLSGREGLVLAGAADSDAGKAGSDLGGLCGLPEYNGIKISPEIGPLLEKTRPDAVILATVSSLARLEGQIEEIAPRGADIVSTCEELSYPWKTQPELAGRIDGIALKHGVAVLGTGVNPGFMMDYLPVVLSGICGEIRAVSVFRIQDAAGRREPFRRKIGAGLSEEEFLALKEKGVLRHVGLAESIYMLAAGIGREVERIEETLTPVMADSDLRAGNETIARGNAAGVEQVACGYAGGEEIIRLVFKASVGEKEPSDTIKIEGEPSLTFTIPGGVNGDVATCAVTVNAVRRVISSPPGLKTMLDIPPPRLSL